MKKKGKDEDSDDGFDEKQVDYEFKIILVGTAEVGKTSITNRYVNDTFNPDQKHSRQVEI
jgi:GTPase SAR1 family protein